MFSIFKAVRQERLDEITVEFSGQNAACVVMASGGYPVKYSTGYPITGLDENGQREDVCVYHAGTKEENGGFITAGGRVLGITALGATLQEAIRLAYEGVGQIHFKDNHYRTDIGKK